MPLLTEAGYLSVREIRLDLHTLSVDSFTAEASSAAAGTLEADAYGR